MKRLVAAGAMVAVGALALSGCAAPDRGGDAGGGAGGPGITVTWNDPFFSYNANTIQGNAAANAIIIQTANTGFYHYNDEPAQVMNEKFGTVEKVSDDPLVVKYTVNEGVKWSDGVQVGGADLLLAWAAMTTHVTAGDIPEPVTDDDGNVTNQDAIDAAADAGIYWGTGATPDSQLDLVKDTPVIGDDGRSLTLTYSKPYVDWRYMMPTDDISIAAHGIAQLAHPDKFNGDAKAATEALVTAIQNKDQAFLSPVATQYRTGYDFTSMPTGDTAELLTLSNGPYVLTDLVADQYAVLTARDDFDWGTVPAYKTITVRIIPEASDAVTALQNGEVQIAYGQPTTDLLLQLEGASGVQFTSGLEGTYEHVDLQVGNGGVFDPATYGGDAEKARLVREAFLLTIPRQEIVDKLIVPLAPDAELRQSNIFLPGAPGYDESAAASGIEKFNEPNIARAQELLAQAGVTNPSVRFLTALNNDRRQQELALITASAQAAGFTIVDASAAEWSTVLTTQTDTYDAALFGWQSTGLGKGESGPNYVTGGTNNFYGWSNPQVDALFNELDVTTDEARIQELAIQAETIVYQEAWSVPIFQFPGVLAWSDSVQNVKAGFLSPNYFWNATEWAPAS